MGIIGGSGLDDPEILEDRKEVYRETPYGIHNGYLTVIRNIRLFCNSHFRVWSIFIK